MWQTLLVNIKSPATKALLHLATPVKISTEEVIITFKNEKLVSQINDTNKKQMLIEATNTMFNQSDSKVTVRLPQSGDDALQNVKSVSEEEKKKITIEEVVRQSKEDDVLEKTTIRQVEETENKETLLQNTQAEAKTDVKKSERVESDQEKMILDLFDGKYIE